VFGSRLGGSFSPSTAWWTPQRGNCRCEQQGSQVMVARKSSVQSVPAPVSLTSSRM
jgi:hypothetical protein